MSIHAEMLWENMYRISDPASIDDQGLLNRALEAFNVTWKKTQGQSLNSQSALTSGWDGHASGGLTVKLLPQEVVCHERYCRKELRDKVYIWHRGLTGHHATSLRETAKRDGVWFLSRNWMRVDEENVIGMEWLKKISTKK